MAKTKFQQNELTRKWIQSYKELAKTKGLSQLKLQKDIGMSQSFTSQILNKRVNFPPKYLDKYCKAYRININSINSNGKFNITGNNKPGRAATISKQRTTTSTRGISSVDKALESIKNALSKQVTASNADISSATKLLINVRSKLASLETDISNIQRALGGTTSKAKRSRRTRK